MTLAKAVENFDSERANGVSIERKIAWISQLDYKISAELSEPRGAEKFGGYTEMTSLETELKAPDEYGEIYSLYMNMKLYYMNGEIARFNNSTLLFNRMFKELSDFINRKQAVIKNTAIKAGDLLV